MIKGKLIELIQQRLNNDSLTPDIWKQAHPLVVAEYVGLAVNSIMYQIFSRDVGGYDTYGKWYYNVQIKTDGTRKYSDMPCTQIQLPDNSYSVRKITLTENKTNAIFAPLNPMSNSVLNRLGTASRMGIISYEVIGGKIWYSDTKYDKVNIFAIPEFTDLKNNENFLIPAGQGEAIINGIMKYFQDVRPKDNELNND